MVIRIIKVLARRLTEISSLWLFGIMILVGSEDPACDAGRFPHACPNDGNDVNVVVGDNGVDIPPVDLFGEFRVEFSGDNVG